EPTAGASQRWAVVDETVLGVQDVEAYTVPGMEPELPSTVTPVYRDGPRGELEVSWNLPGDGRWQRPGTVEVEGTVHDVLGERHEATAVVAVDAFGATEPASAVTYAGGEPELPRTVTAVGDHGGRASVPVTWE